MNEFFFVIHRDLPREGPGNNEATRKAFALLRNLPPQSLILDIGCGPGMQTVELAKISNGKIIASQTKGGEGNYPRDNQGEKNSQHQGKQRKSNSILFGKDSSGIGTYCEERIMPQRKLTTITYQDVESY